MNPTLSTSLQEDIYLKKSKAMAIFKFYTSVCDYGTIIVEADTLEEAENKAYQLDGDYVPHEQEVLDIDLAMADMHYGSAQDRQEWDEEQWRDVICELVGSMSEDRVAEMWNECIDHMDEGFLSEHPTLTKVFLNDERNLSLMGECLTDKEKTRVMMSLADGSYLPSERYFYVTSDCRIGSCNSIWSEVVYEPFYQFLINYR